MSLLLMWSGSGPGIPPPPNQGNICGVVVLPLVPAGQLFHNPIMGVVDASILDGVLAAAIRPAGEVIPTPPPIGQISECDDA